MIISPVSFGSRFIVELNKGGVDESKMNNEVNTAFVAREIGVNVPEYTISQSEYETKGEGKGIELDGNSNVIFTCIEKDGEICSCQLQTGYNYMDAPHKDDGDCWGGGLVWPIGKFKKHKFVHGHGYYECRCKLQKKES